MIPAVRNDCAAGLIEAAVVLGFDHRKELTDLCFDSVQQQLMPGRNVRYRAEGPMATASATSPMTTCSKPRVESRSLAVTKINSRRFEGECNAGGCLYLSIGPKQGLVAGAGTADIPCRLWSESSISANDHFRYSHAVH